MSIHSPESIAEFLDPVNRGILSEDESYKDNQLGKHIDVYEDVFPDLEQADLVLVGCNETRGGGIGSKGESAANAVRKKFYGLYHWHKEVRVADAGNVKTGASLQDSYAALQAVVAALVQEGKKVVIIGGSHDLTLAQYQVYAAVQQVIEVTCVDACINLDMESDLPASRFLMQMLTATPNFIRHYNHIGFQSYLVHPAMLETIHKLGFDCFRAGRVKESLEEMEPVLRNTSLLSFDISAIQNSHAPANRLTPNGFSGEEACTLMQYAGMSQQLSTIGLYGYEPGNDVNQLTATQLSHMLWYLMDGIYKGKQEALLEDRGHFQEYHLAFAEMETNFLQSRRTGRWWMQLPNGTYLACSAKDYATASNNDIPERWLRAIERS